MRRMNSIAILRVVRVDEAVTIKRNMRNAAMNSRLASASFPSDSIDMRIEQRNWASIHADLSERGCAVLPKLLDADECESIAQMYDDKARFRNRVIMSRHGYGRGEYQYFNYPLPSLVQQLRVSLYCKLVPIANDWHAALKLESRFQEHHESFVARCHAAGQLRPTPLVLRYETGDYNCLHQDIYGEHIFPLQVAILLSRPDVDFEGGEFVLTEQRPRMQSRVDVVPLVRGDAVIFAVHQRPVAGARGTYRVNMRHGVSRLRDGRRHTLGIIFHDAK